MIIEPIKTPIELGGSLKGMAKGRTTGVGERDQERLGMSYLLDTTRSSNGTYEKNEKNRRYYELGVKDT